MENLRKIPIKIGIIDNDFYQGTLRAQIERTSEEQRS